MEDIQLIIISSLIIILASFIQGATGFGFVLVSAPLLSLFLPLTTLVPTLVILGLFINILIVASTRKHIALKEIKILIFMGIIGIPIGVYGLNTLDTAILKLIIGAIIIFTSIAMFIGLNLTLKNKLYSYSIAGLASGILNGSISMSGPPIVLFLTNEGYDKDKFRANINTYFVINNMITVFVL